MYLRLKCLSLLNLTSIKINDLRCNIPDVVEFPRMQAQRRPRPVREVLSRRALCLRPTDTSLERVLNREGRRLPNIGGSVEACPRESSKRNL